jgi:hypothetical protein
MGRNGNIVCRYFSGHVGYGCSCITPPNSEVFTKWWRALWALVQVQHMSQPSLSAYQIWIIIHYLSRCFVRWNVYIYFWGPLCIINAKLIKKSLLSRYPKVYDRVHNNTPLVLSLSNMNPMHTITACCIRDPFYYYLPSIPRSPKRSFILKLSNKYNVVILSTGTPTLLIEAASRAPSLKWRKSVSN